MNPPPSSRGGAALRSALSAALAGCAAAQWNPAGQLSSNPLYSVALSADGTTALGFSQDSSTALNFFTKSTAPEFKWSQVQSISLLRTGAVAISGDGSLVAVISTYTSSGTIGLLIFSRPQLGDQWGLAQNISLASLGIRSGSSIVHLASSQDFSVLIAADTDSNIFVLEVSSNATVLIQELGGLPIPPFALWSSVLCGDGSTLFTLWCPALDCMSGTGNVVISFARGDDGQFSLLEELVYTDPQVVSIGVSYTGAVFTAMSIHSSSRATNLYIYTRRKASKYYELKVEIDDFTSAGGGHASLALSKDGSIIFALADTDSKTSDPLFVFAKSGSSWAQQEIISGAFYPLQYDTSSPVCSGDGSTVILCSMQPSTPCLQYIYESTPPAPTITATASATATSSSSASASATCSAMSSSSASATSSATSSSSASATSSATSSSTSPPSASASPTSSTPAGASSTSATALPPAATVSISVLATLLACAVGYIALSIVRRARAAPAGPGASEGGRDAPLLYTTVN